MKALYFQQRKMSANAQVIPHDSGTNICYLTNVQHNLHIPEWRYSNSTTTALEKACLGQNVAQQMIHPHEIKRLMMYHVFEEWYRMLNGSHHTYLGSKDHSQRYYSQINKTCSRAKNTCSNDRLLQPKETTEAENVLDIKYLTVHSYQLKKSTNNK